MVAILRDSTIVDVIAVMHTCPRAIPLAMCTKRKSTHGFPFSFLYEYGAPLGSPFGPLELLGLPKRKLSDEYFITFVSLFRDISDPMLHSEN